MTNKTISAAIIGMGNWGQTLVNSVQGLSEQICFPVGTTRTPERAEDFARRQGIEMLPDLNAVLERKDIDAVVLATPHSQHLQQIEAAAAAGKHVFCEKPLTLTVEDARAAYAAAQKAGAILAIGHNRRFLPAYRKFAQLVAEDIGTPQQFIGNFSWAGSNYRPSSWRNSLSESPAGGMAGLGIHMVDAMIGLGLDANKVTVATRQDATGARSKTVTALIDGGTGPLAVLTTMSGPGRFWRLEAFGSEGWAAMDGEHRVVFGRPGDAEQRWDFTFTDMERGELEGFAAAVQGHSLYPIDSAQGIRGIALFEAIVRAASQAPGGQSSAEIQR